MKGASSANTGTSATGNLSLFTKKACDVKTPGELLSDCRMNHQGMTPAESHRR